jgi:hypothetical protein
VCVCAEELLKEAKALLGRRKQQNRSDDEDEDDDDDDDQGSHHPALATPANPPLSSTHSSEERWGQGPWNLKGRSQPGSLPKPAQAQALACSGVPVVP